ncbi:cholinesterase 1-like [Pollicipes pollicipes]|uniref:cholinesterase 1-like n=1 Tax=Pollicipes pollicipes TaxID=41117 RepID=UPI001884D490|nr:cholinesterase 1-like [Pollicipes pollicipes]
MVEATVPVPDQLLHVFAVSGGNPIRLRALQACLLTLAATLAAGQGFDTPVITIGQGSLRGVREYVESTQRSVYAYRGVPYAAPPIGRLRFQAPERHTGWNRTQLFDRYGPACPQLDTQGVPETGVSEDCLTLNIWIPEAPVGFRRFPVVVFLDGELFWRQRSSKFPMKDLAAEELVIVSVSYRTNIFGFLTLRSRSAPGNLGLRDQHLALRWVRDNIGAFGGDSRRVTLLGFSAGAASVGLHMVSPRSQGLFQRAVMMSGSPLASWAHMSSVEARRVGEELAAIMGCRDISDVASLRCLQRHDFLRLLTATQRILESRSRFFPVFAPVTDSFLPSGDRVIPDDPVRLLRFGNYAKVPLMAGMDHDDGIVMLYQYPGTDRLTFSNLTLIMRRVVIPRLLDQYRLTQQRQLLERVLSYRYIDSVPPGSQELMLASFVKIFGDAYFAAPMYQFMEMYARAGAVIYGYGFTERGPDIFGNVVTFQGAGHGSELLYLLGPTMFRLLVGNAYGRPQQRLGIKLRDYWTAFITDGDPIRGSFGERWRRFSLDEPSFYNLAGSVVEVGYRREDAGYWNTFLPFIEGGGSTVDPIDPTTTQPLVDQSSPYQVVMWVLVALILILIIGLIVAFFLTRKWKRSRSDLSFR